MIYLQHLMIIAQEERGEKMRLIDADAFLEEARNRIDMQDMYLPIHIQELVIDEMPTMDAKPIRHAKWIKIGMIDRTLVVHRCSDCGYQTIDNGRYCTECGARMDEGD